STVRWSMSTGRPVSSRPSCPAGPTRRTQGSSSPPSPPSTLSPRRWAAERSGSQVVAVLPELPVGDPVREPLDLVALVGHEGCHELLPEQVAQVGVRLE